MCQRGSFYERVSCLGQRERGGIGDKDLKAGREGGGGKQGEGVSMKSDEYSRGFWRKEASERCQWLKGLPPSSMLVMEWSPSCSIYLSRGRWICWLDVGSWSEYLWSDTLTWDSSGVSGESWKAPNSSSLLAFGGLYTRLDC